MSDLHELSCGHSCVVAAPRGMATNGPCHCLTDLGTEQRRRVQFALMEYRRQLRLLREVELAGRDLRLDCCGEPNEADRRFLAALAKLDAVRGGEGGRG